MRLNGLTRRLEFSRWLWTLGASSADSARLVGSYNSRAVRKRLRLHGISPVTVQLRLNQSSLPFRFGDLSDFSVLEEVFRERQYLLELDTAPRTILDLGSNTGLSVLFFHAMFPEAHVFAIEAHPTAFASLKANAARWRNVTPIHAAAVAKSGPVVFYGSPERGMSSSIFQRRATDVPVEVTGENLATLLDRCGPTIDVLKFDIEGAEFDLFANFDQWSRLGTVIGEVHPDLYGGTLEQFLELFPKHSSRIMQRMGQRAIVRFDPR